MYITRYLVVSSRGRCRITRGSPSLASDEILLSLDLRLPETLFRKPIIKAKVEIPEASVTPAALNAEVLLNTKELLEKGLGMRVELVAPVPPAEPTDNSEEERT